MTVVQTNTENQQKVSLPRRIATYITSMNFAKVFRRHHTKESSTSIPKLSERPSFIHHHRYPRPFSYHIPTTEQLSPSSLNKTSNVIPYRIGLSSDSTLLVNGQTNENDDIVRLPIKNGREHSPKIRKDRRYQSQLNANKRWLFRSMETLDGWKGKVFPQKIRTNNSSQSRSRSVENLADKELDENKLFNHNSSIIKQQRAISPNKSIEAITNRVINSIGIHRKSVNSIPNITNSPALTIKKQPLFTHLTNNHNSISKQCNNNNNEIKSSAILDFREISSLGFLHSRSGLNDENENISLTPSENIINALNSSDDENEEIISNLSYLANDYDHNLDADNETADSWDFSITWIDSLKEQHSPQRKIQFYENLIKLLEQDTLNIDELLVLRKVLAKIWPTDEITTIDYNNQIFSIDSKPIGTKSLHASNNVKRRPKLSTMTHHTAQRCSAIIEQSPLVYEPLHEQNSGHITQPSSLLYAVKAKPCLIENNTELISNEKEDFNIEQNYPQHLNPFNEETNITPSAPPEESNHNNNESIRRYFERLTLLETIYEKLNIESNKTPLETIDHHHKFSPEENISEASTQNYRPIEKQIEMKEEILNHPHPYSTNKTATIKTASNRFIEMNVDGNGSVSSGKSSIKRRAPTAPHLSQNDNSHHHHCKTNPTMFTLSSTDLNLPHLTNHETNIPIQIKSHNGKLPREINTNERIIQSTQNIPASCDDDGHIFVYESNSNPIQNPIDEKKSIILPNKTEHIQQWLSSCETKEEPHIQNNIPLPLNPSPKTQLKMRCIAKPIRNPNPSPQHYHEKQLSPINNNEIEPGRFRSCLKIHLDTNDPTIHRNQPSSTTSRQPQRQQTPLDEHLNITDDEYFQQNILPSNYQLDHQAVFL